MPLFKGQSGERDSGQGKGGAFRPLGKRDEVKEATSPSLNNNNKSTSGIGLHTFLPLRESQQPLLTLTLGLGRLHLHILKQTQSHGRQHSSCHERSEDRQFFSSLELRGGRLDVGPHLPLLLGRWRYTKTIGEGVSAQVIEDYQEYLTLAIRSCDRTAEGGWER